MHRHSTVHPQLFNSVRKSTSLLPDQLIPDGGSTTLKHPMFPHRVAQAHGWSAHAAVLLVAAALAAPSAASPRVAPPGDGQATDVVHHRLFLHDGAVLVSFGEFTRVGTRVVLSMPIGGTDAAPLLHLLTIDEAEVDWERTDAYARAARARRYAETRGEADFAALTREVTGTLHQVGFVSDSAERLALAEHARRRLLEWPRLHHGYRADEVAQLGTWLDQVVSELRIAAGQSAFDLALVAPVPAPDRVEPLRAPPTLRERIELAIVGSERTVDSAERISLLRSVLESLQPANGEAGWMASVRERASAALAVELRIDRAYGDLVRRTMSRADILAGRADVRSLDALIHGVLDEDRRLQHARPGTIAGLLATLDFRIDEARRLRLARDAWALRRAIVRDYWASIREPLDRLLGLRAWLTDVRQLAGPAPASVRRLADHAKRATEELRHVQPAAEVAAVHATFSAAAALASRASAARLDAVRSGSMDTAWQASSAAAGSLLLLEQALDELRRITYAPAP